MVAYGVTVVLSVITTVVLLFIALGYQFDSSGDVVKSGLVLVDNKPEAGQIYINGELEDNQAPGRFILPVGTYEVSLEREGYLGWKKNFTIAAQSVEQIDYPILLPKELTPKALLQISRPTVATQSPDSKKVLYFTTGQNAIMALQLNPDTPRTSVSPLPAAFTRQGGAVGAIEFVDWTLNSKRVLIRHTLPNQSVEYVSYDPENTENSINITKAFAAFPPEQPQYVGGETGIVYGLHQGVLRRYTITDQKAEVVLERIVSYKPFGDQTVAFTRQSEDGLSIEAGLLDQDTTAVLERYSDIAARPLIAYSEYDDRSYLVIADQTAGVTRIYRDPLSKPILTKQVPYVTLTTGFAQKIEFSTNNQYVYIQTGSTFVSYDFENVRGSSFVLEGEIVGGSPRWMNNSHLSYQLSDGKNYLVEFDGQNKKTLITTDPGVRLFYAGDQRNAYRIISNATTTSLELLPLVAE